jgi:unsaturated chondroitin disaccharide hydrolase
MRNNDGSGSCFGWPLRYSPFLIFVVIIILATIACSQSVFASGELDSLVANALKISLIRLERSVAEVNDTTLYPTYATPQLAWKLERSDNWTSGFYPGCLWYAYEISGDPRFERWARQWTASIEGEKSNLETHDLGFKFMCSFGNGLRLGKGPAYATYREIMSSAAQTLAKRYDPTIGCLRSNWDLVSMKNSFPVIIDIMMNLEILFWASQNGGPSSFGDIARRHATTTCRDFVRADGSTYHVVRYDKNTGRVINKGTLQGAGDETTWSRGQAWGLYGMVVAYRFTKDAGFLAMAVRLADYFLSHLPEDHVAPWDFQSGIRLRDVSATCIATSALFEMIRYVENPGVKQQYMEEAEAMLTSLCRPPYFTVNGKTNCLLDHSVHNLPAKTNVDVPAIFADYYFLEALLRYRADCRGETR